MADQEQSNIRQEYNNATVGLNMDQIPSQLAKGKYTYALNATLENFDANGYTIQNEPGNEWCLDFPEGFILIGKHFIVEQTKHIFFLTNPATSNNQIGYMENNDCIYHILVDAPCLNFNINYPIHKVVHKITNCTTEIYWTDGLNPRRYLDINDIPKIIRWGTPLCDPVYSCDIDCNQLKIQANFDIPLLEIVDVNNTGNIIAGTYQFAIQYADASGNPYTSYYSITNPTPIGDSSITTPNFNYPVGKAIVIDIQHLDITGMFSYFNIAVIKTINAITSVELVGTYSIEKNNLQITYTGQNVTNIRLSINDIFERYPYYDIAQDLTTAQDVLIWDQLSSVDRTNYQKIANFISLQWETWRIPATENYADELNATNLRSYLRDEVYPFEIQFLLDNGKQTDGFHIPGRVKNFNEFIYPDIAENSTDDFIGEPIYYNGGIGYSPYWKIYNTATVTDFSSLYTTAPDYKGPYQYGEFAYWESIDEYPCNTDVWGDLAGEKIRHHKFPDVLVSPIYESKVFVDKSSMIMDNEAVFPIGIRVDIQQIERLIQSSELTADQKSEIVGFKILRGDRSTNKSIVAKGILRNVNIYKREEKEYYFPNYPYNDLREDPFLNLTNNAYIEVCDAFTVNITQLFHNPSRGYDCALVQYVDCNINKSSVKEYRTLGEQEQLCSIGKPVITFGKGTVSYINYDLYNLRYSPENGVMTCGGWEVTYNEITDGIKIEEVSSGAFYPPFFIPFDDYDVKVVVGTVPECTNNCDRGGICGTVYDIIFKGSFITASACVDPQPIPSYTDKYRQIFNSPETSFAQPFLGDILKLESVLYGKGKAHFREVEKNAKYKLLSEDAQKKALDSSAELAGMTNNFDLSAFFAAYQSYLTIYTNGITRKNYAYSFNSIASYDYSNSVPNNIGAKQRNIDIAKYLIPAVVSIEHDKDINNWQRESSVYIKTIKELPFPDSSPNMLSGTLPILTEESRFTISEKENCNQPGKEEDIYVVSYYASLKKNFINQWGQIYSYETIDTGFQSIFDISVPYITVFGGDTFISRFAFKTKLPFFIDNRVEAPDDSDIFYDEIGNIAYPKYWHSARAILKNYTIPSGRSNDNPGTLANFISYKAHNFDCPNDISIVTTIVSSSTTTTTTIKQVSSEVTDGDSEITFYDGYFYLFAYGIPNFYCETSYNVDLRQAFNNKEGDFWPHVSNSIPDDWVQEYFVSIANDNTYYYNFSFSKQNRETYFSHLPADWDDNPCYTHYPFRAIYSDSQNTDSDNRVNAWRIYRAVSYYDFPQNFGNLVSLDGIQNKAILARFVNKTLMYGNLLTIDTSNPQAAYIGNPNLFRKDIPPVDFADTDLGYAGSQHKLLLKIPEGQVTIDAKRGQVFLLSGTEVIDISKFGSGMNRFLTDHLGFEILRYFPTINIDNHYNGLGLHAVYDAKYDRIIITKLDYTPLDSNIIYDSECTLEFYLNEKIISIKDPDYFCNKSWTLSFNINTKSWISFHSYLPNFYIAENNFFYSGMNDCCSDFDFVAYELPSPFNCDLEGYAVLPGCEWMITTTTTTTLPPTTTTTTTTIAPTTTTTTTLPPTTTTTTTTIAPTTTTTTTECKRTGELENECFITGHTIHGVTVISTGSAIAACYEMHWLQETPDIEITVNCIPVETTDGINIGSIVYLSNGTNDCTCLDDGWYFTADSMNEDYVFHVVGCKIVKEYSCATTTTTTTLPPTTTTTTTRVWACELEGTAEEVCTTTTTSTTIEPTTTTTSTTCYLGVEFIEVICEDVTTTTTTTTIEEVTTTTTTTEEETTTTTTTTEEPFLKFTFTPGNAPVNLSAKLTFNAPFVYGDLVQTDGTDTITLTGSALAEITNINVGEMNVVSAIDGLVFCTSLTYLECTANTLTTLPTLPVSLTELYCGTNNLIALPTLPASLTVLDCYENSLTELSTLPDGLTYLDCCTNSITELPVLPNGLIDFYCFNNLLTSAEMDAITIELDNAGLSNGFYDWNPQTNLQEPNQTAAAYLSLIVKGWILG
jgi:hypothetical protein